MNVFREDILDTIRESILVLDSSLNVIYANEAFYELFKVSPADVLNRYIYDLGNGQWDIPGLHKLFDGVSSDTTSFNDLKISHDFPTIGQKVMLINAKQLSDGSREEKYIFVAIEDITEKTKILESSLQANKLSMIGQLSAGIAHGLSSPLTGIHNFLDIYVKQEPEDGARKQEYKLMLEACDYMNKIVKNLTYFARTTKDEMEKVSLADVINSTLIFSERQFISSNIFIVKEILEEPKDIKGNKAQLQHVLLNLLINAKEAMSGGGEIKVKAWNSEDGNFVFLEVSDNGKGIAKEDLPHVFEPFFTTKKEQYGSGLGLSAVYGIIKNHQGEINIESEERKGTRVLVKFNSLR